MSRARFCSARALTVGKRMQWASDQRVSWSDRGWLLLHYSYLPCFEYNPVAESLCIVKCNWLTREFMYLHENKLIQMKSCWMHLSSFNVCPIVNSSSYIRKKMDNHSQMLTLLRTSLFITATSVLCEHVVQCQIFGMSRIHRLYCMAFWY